MKDDDKLVGLDCKMPVKPSLPVSVLQLIALRPHHTHTHQRWISMTMLSEGRA